MEADLVKEGLSLWHLVGGVAAAAVGAVLWAHRLHSRNRDKIHMVDLRVEGIEAELRSHKDGDQAAFASIDKKMDKIDVKLDKLGTQVDRLYGMAETRWGKSD